MAVIPAAHSVLRRRWDRLHLQVRCGLMPGDASCIRQYLLCGAQLVRRGCVPAQPAHARMLQTLLQVAADEGLPWFWRSVCLEHVTMPLARLAPLVGPHDPIAWQAIEAAVQQARDRLPAPPRIDPARSPGAIG